MDVTASPLRICLVNAYFPPYSPGGAEVSVELMAGLLASRGHDVSVVVPGPSGRSGKESRDGYTVHWIPSSARVSPGNRFDLSTYVGSPAFVSELSEGTASVARDVGADVIHSQNAVSWQAAVLAARALGIPSAATVRDPSVLCPTGICMMDDPAALPTPCRGRWSFMQCSRTYLVRSRTSMPWPHQVVHAHRLWSVRAAQRHWLARSDAVIAVSDALRSQLERHVLRAGHGLHRVYNPSIGHATRDTESPVLARYGLEPGDYFLVAGKKSLGKGTFVALSAAASLAAAACRAPLVFFGPGVSLPRTIGVRDYPSVSQAEVQHLIRKARAVVVPSLVFEGLPRGMLDALAAGVPLVVTDSGGQREGVIDGVNGYIVPKGDAAALARAMERICGWDDATRSRAALASAALLRDRFSADGELTRLEAIYRGLLRWSAA